MKKSMAIMLIAVLFTGLFTGCGSEKTIKEVTRTPQLTEEVTLTFGSHQSGLPSTGIMQELAADFEEETGIKIEFQITPDTEWDDLLKEKLESGEGPDIICADSEPLSIYMKFNPEKNLVALNNEEWVSRMDSSVLPSISYKEKVYGITFAGPKMYVYLYNKQIFLELGLEPPTTYEEFKTVCQTLKDAGVTPIYECAANGWHQVLPVYENAGLYTRSDDELFDKLNINKTSLEDIPGMLKIITQMKEFADLGYYHENYLTNSVEDAKQAMATGKAAIFLNEAGWANEIEADYPEFSASNLGIFAMPWGDNQTIGVNPASNAYFINADSEYKEEAKLFFEFLARPENLKRRLDGQTGLLQLCWPEIPSKYPKEYEEYLNSKEKELVMQVGVKYVATGFLDMGDDLVRMYKGEITPQEVITLAQKRREEQAELFKDATWQD